MHALSSLIPYFLTLDSQCTQARDCPATQACLNGQCKDPCTLRGACGDRALCQTVQHEVVCSCPQCYVGRPKLACRPDPACDDKKGPIEGPNNKTITACQANNDCSDNLACDLSSEQCYDPCLSGEKTECEPNKMCEVRKHKATCICKYGFVVNSVGEFVCAGGKIECRTDEECASNLGCMYNKCVNPCNIGKPCGDGKTCEVMNHKPICICTEGCAPAISICLNDDGCPVSQACISYQCVDPCSSHSCPGDTPCYVEDHKPLCKFCPNGFTVDPNHGCIKGKRKPKILLLQRLDFNKLT